MIMVSVIIPVYNVEKYIEECLDSVLNQTMKALEVICVDDGSTDGSLTILRDYRYVDTRVKILMQENQGSGLARNRGIREAQGKYVVFLDADDFWYDEWVLEKIVKAAEENNSCVTGAFWGNVKGGRYQRSKLHSQYFQDGSMGRWIDFKEEQDCMGYCSYLFLREFLVGHNICFPAYYRFQDPPFLTEALICVRRYYVIPVDWHCYRTIYKDTLSTVQKTNDFVRGVIDVLKFSQTYHLEKLSGEMIRQINESSHNIVNSILQGNAEMFWLLGQVQNYMDGYKEEIAPVILLRTAMREKCEIVAGEFRERLKDVDRLVIYGAGKYGHFLLDWVKKSGAKTEIVFAETVCVEAAVEDGIKCVQIDQLAGNNEKTLVVIAVTPNVQPQMAENLRRLEFENYMFLNREMMTALEYASWNPHCS